MSHTLVSIKDLIKSAILEADPKISTDQLEKLANKYGNSGTHVTVWNGN